MFGGDIEARGEEVNLHKLFTEFQESKDPTVLTVMVEYSAALLGIAIAAIGIYLSDVINNMIYDAFASISIGAVLMLFAFFWQKKIEPFLLGKQCLRRIMLKL